jgi:hypothetical protein
LIGDLCLRRSDLRGVTGGEFGGDVFSSDGVSVLTILLKELIHFALHPRIIGFAIAIITFFFSKPLTY